MLRFMIKLPFRIIAAPVWLVLAVVNIVLVFLVGLSAGFCYLIAGISVVTEVLSIGFGISTDWTMKSAIITTVVFVLLPDVYMRQGKLCLHKWSRAVCSKSGMNTSSMCFSVLTGVQAK